MKLTKLALALSSFFALSACTHHDNKPQPIVSEHTAQIDSSQRQIVAMNDQKINDGSDGSAPEQPVTSDYSDNVGSGVESSYHESEIPRGTNSGATTANPSVDSTPSNGSSAAGSEYSGASSGSGSTGAGAGNGR